MRSDCGRVGIVALRPQKGRQIVDGRESEVFRAKVDTSGRIVLPMEVRQRNAFDAGSTVLIVSSEHGVQLRSPEQALKEAQDYFCSLAPADELWSEELIAERRAEAERE